MGNSIANTETSQMGPRPGKRQVDHDEGGDDKRPRVESSPLPGHLTSEKDNSQASHEEHEWVEVPKSSGLKIHKVIFRWLVDATVCFYIILSNSHNPNILCSQSKIGRGLAELPFCFSFFKLDTFRSTSAKRYSSSSYLRSFITPNTTETIFAHISRFVPHNPGSFNVHQLTYTSPSLTDSSDHTGPS